MQYSELGRVAAVWSASGEPNMKACFGFSAPSIAIDLRNKTQQQQVMEKIYAGLNWEVPKLLQMMPDATDYYFDAAAQIHMERWSAGRVALAGDAAYCASPMSGQGTSLALIGAYVLAGELVAAKGDYQAAFDHYESMLCPFVIANQALGVTAAKLMRSQEKKNLLTSLLASLMKIAPGRLIKFFIDLSTRRINQVANSIAIKDY